MPGLTRKKTYGMMMKKIVTYSFVYVISCIYPLVAVDYDNYNPFEFYQMEPLWWAGHLWYPNALEHAKDCPCGNYDKYKDED